MAKTKAELQQDNRKLRAELTRVRRELDDWRLVAEGNAKDLGMLQGYLEEARSAAEDRVVAEAMAENLQAQLGATVNELEHQRSVVAGLRYRTNTLGPAKVTLLQALAKVLPEFWDGYMAVFVRKDTWIPAPYHDPEGVQVAAETLAELATLDGPEVLSRLTVALDRRSHRPHDLVEEAPRGE